MTAEPIPSRSAGTSHAPGTDVVGHRIAGPIVDVVVVLTSRNRRHPGDMVAGTLVVRSRS